MADQTQQVETILKLSVDYTDGIRKVGEYIREIDKLKAEKEQLSRIDERNRLGEKAWGEAMAKNEAVTKQLKGEMKVLTTEIKKKLEADREEIKSIDIANASYNKLSQTYTAMKKKINEMSAAEREQNKAYIEQSKKVYDRMKDLQAQTGKMQLNVGNYQSAITGLITGNNKFASSIIGMTNGANSMGSAFSMITANVKALGQTLMTLMANPVFMAIAGIAGAGMAFSWWKDYNDGLTTATRLTQQFTGLAGDNLSVVRDSIQATADAFDKDFKEVLQASDTLVGQYGLTWQDAVNILNKGFAAGADINGDMLQQIKQYAPALKDAGLSAEEFVAIIQQTRSGLFSKDGLDLITKASRSLRDMTDSTAASLRGIGINAEDLKRRLASGDTSMMGAIQEISSKLKDVSANSQEAGAIISDVFGKKGVAAGQAQIKAFADLETSLDKLVKKEGEYGELQQKLVETQQLLNQYLSTMFGMRGWDEMKLKAEIFGKTLVIYVLRNLAKAYNYTVDWWNASKMIANFFAQVLVAAVSTAWGAMRTFFNLVTDAVSAVGTSFKGLGNIIIGAFTFDIDAIKAGMAQFTGALKGAWSSAVISASKYGSAAAKAWGNAWDNTINTQKTAHISLPTFDGLGKTTTNGTTDDTDLLSPTSPTSGGKSSKGGKSSSKNTVKAVTGVDIAKVLDQANTIIQKKLEEEVKIRQKVIQSKLAIIKKGTEEEMRLQLDLLYQEETLEKKRIEKEVSDTQQKEELLTNLAIQYEQKRKAVREEFATKEREEIEQKFANDYAERIMNASTEIEQDRIRLEQLARQREEMRRMDGESEEAYRARLIAAAQEEKDMRDKIAKEEIEIELNKVEAMASLAGGISQILEAAGKDSREALVASKVLAIAEVAIQQGIAIAHAITAASKGSVSVFDMAAKIAVGIATVVASITQAIDSINSAKFAKGGLITGAGTGTSDSITARVSNGESVMTANATAMFSPLLSALNQLGGGVPIVQGGGNTQMGEDMLAAAIARGYALAPSPVVSVKEISQVSNRVKVIETMSKS